MNKNFLAFENIERLQYFIKKLSTQANHDPYVLMIVSNVVCNLLKTPSLRVQF
jgi:hypothetical protein